jgi:hypothetical protein
MVAAPRPGEKRAQRLCHRYTGPRVNGQRAHPAHAGRGAGGLTKKEKPLL